VSPQNGDTTTAIGGVGAGGARVSLVTRIPINNKYVTWGWGPARGSTRGAPAAIQKSPAKAPCKRALLKSLREIAANPVSNPAITDAPINVVYLSLEQPTSASWRACACLITCAWVMLCFNHLMRLLQCFNHLMRLLLCFNHPSGCPPPLLLLLNLLDVDGDEALGEAPKARHRVG
jgi:hypothetical protein